jgi:hypothetical protein
MFKRLGTRAVQILVIAVAAGIGGAAVAYATIPDSNGLIHGCYKTGNGDLRVIDGAGGSCKPGETALNWTQIKPVLRVAFGPAAGPGGKSEAEAKCNSDEVVLSGGAAVNNSPTANDWAITYTFPASDGSNGWVGQARNESAVGDIVVVTHVLCVPAT